MTTRKPLLTLERNNAKRLFIGVTEFDERGYGIHSYVLAYQESDHTADSTMVRRFADMVRLMDGNVEVGDALGFVNR